MWTTDGEPVIHIIGGPNSCSKIDKRDSNIPDIMNKGFPLVHIGNWRSGNTITSLNQKKLPQIRQVDDLRCTHETNSSGKFLDAIIWGTRLQVLIKGREMELETLPAFESPFNHLKSTRRISIESGKEDVKQATDAMKEVSITGDNLAARGEILSPPTDELKHAVNIGETNRRREDPVYLRRQEYQKEFAVNRYDFEVFMFEEDYQMMVSLVFKYPNLETGGDLFGLWTTKGDAVLHFILGPGQNCKRTGASFYQDIGYLQRNGELLTEGYMLCHIGEWHSHHQLHLFQPNGGDSSTLIRNYPRGVCGFLLIIANILSSHRVELSPYLYTQTSSHSYDLKGALTVLRVPNPFKSMRNIKHSTDQGREVEGHLLHESHDFSGYRLKSYETGKYSSQRSARNPFRTHESPESKSSQYVPIQNFHKPPIPSVSGQHTIWLNSPRKDLAHPYKVSTPVTSSKHSRRIGEREMEYTRVTKKQPIRPAWKF